MAATHEDFTRIQKVKTPSNRSFGWVFTSVFLVLGLWPLVKHGELRIWALIASLVFLILTLLVPNALAVPNRLWQKVGFLLHRIVSPLALFLLFYGVVTPTGLAMRASSRSGHRWRRDSAARSYWTVRTPPGPAPDSLRNQF